MSGRYRRESYDRIPYKEKGTQLVIKGTQLVLFAKTYVFVDGGKSQYPANLSPRQQKLLSHLLIVPPDRCPRKLSPAVHAH